jgi:uncharacterized membrane protein YqjE
MQNGFGDRSLKDLVNALINDVTGLVRNEIDLAKAEAGEKAGQVGFALVYIVAGGLLGFAGFLVLLNAVVVELAERLHPALAALIVGGVIVALGVIVLLAGTGKLKGASLTPRRTIDNLGRDKALIEEKL